MQIFSTALLTATILGSAIVPGWCPEPADLKTSLTGSTGATAAVNTPQCEDGPRPEMCKRIYGKRHPGAMNRMSDSPIKAAAGKYQNPSAPIAKPAGGGAVLVRSSNSSAMDRLSGGSSYAPPSGAIKKTAQSGNTATQQAQPRTAAPRVSSGPIDYGGCAGCGKRDTFRQPR